VRRWNQIGGVVLGTAVATAADEFGGLDWHFSFPLGALAYFAVRLRPCLGRGREHEK
jgi:hypothetical protein